jgi:hypothetical protein
MVNKIKKPCTRAKFRAKKGKELRKIRVKKLLKTTKFLLIKAILVFIINISNLFTNYRRKKGAKTRL